MFTGTFGLFSDPIIRADFNQDIGNWNVSNVTNMSSMFVLTYFNQNIGNWDVSSVTDMSGMFAGDYFNQNIGNWNVGNVTTISSMFIGDINFNQNIGNWDVSSVKYMNSVFDHASSFNQDIGGWNVSNVIQMNRMFNSASSFNQNIDNWDVSHVTDMTNMFTDATLSTANYDALLNGWNALPSLQSNVPFSGGNSTNGEVARTNFINTYSWTITDAGLDCSGLSIDQFDVNALALYPNPSTGEFYVKNATGESFSVYSVLGQEVYSTTLTGKQEIQEINLSFLHAGLYIAKISDGLYSAKQRIVIK